MIRKSNDGEIVLLQIKISRMQRVCSHVQNYIVQEARIYHHYYTQSWYSQTKNIFLNLKDNIKVSTTDVTVHTNFLNLI
jgi:hypothetical protein